MNGLFPIKCEIKKIIFKSCSEYLISFILFCSSRKNNLSFSYGENFNSLNDFINLINFYKFSYINPDISHYPISDFYRLINYMKRYKINVGDKR